MATIGLLPSNISNQSTADDEDWFFSVNSELVHGVDNTEKGLDGLGFLANHGLVDGKLKLVVVKVLLELSTVNIKDVGIHDGQSAAPSLVALSELRVLLVENTIEEGEVVLDLLVTLDVETSFGLLDGSVEVRHFRCEEGCRRRCVRVCINQVTERLVVVSKIFVLKESWRKKLSCG